jgi:putative RecB family exonuclease
MIALSGPVSRALPLSPASPSDPNSGPLDYLSASRLKCWQECRLKFFFRYVERIPSSSSPALFVGKAVHHVLQQWNLARWRGQDAEAAAMEPHFLQYWEALSRDEGIDCIDWKGKESEHREKAWGMLEHYLRHTPIPLEEKPEAVEVIVECDLASYGHDLPPLRGVIDPVRAGGCIVDFKTSARTPDEELACLLHATQLGTYALLYREATGHEESGFELQFLIKTKQPALVVTSLSPVTPAQVRRLFRLMESLVRGVAAEDYIPSPGLQCSYCDYQTQCRSGR